MRLAKVDDPLALLFPPTCALCGEPGQRCEICDPCCADLPWIRHGCSLCSRPLPPAAAPGPCGHCRWPPTALARVIAGLVYEYPVDRLVAGCKYRGRLELGQVLGELLAARIAVAARQPGWQPPDLLLPVPLHPAREASRGFNQAAEIARVLQRRLGIPVARRLARRLRATPEQAALGAEARAANLRGAFAVGEGCAGRRIALVDDVITTGATAIALAQAARAAGAEDVQCWVVALTW